MTPRPGQLVPTCRADVVVAESIAEYCAGQRRPTWERELTTTTFAYEKAGKTLEKVEERSKATNVYMDARLQSSRTRKNRNGRRSLRGRNPIVGTWLARDSLQDATDLTVSGVDRHRRQSRRKECCRIRAQSLSAADSFGTARVVLTFARSSLRTFATSASHVTGRLRSRAIWRTRMTSLAIL